MSQNVTSTHSVATARFADTIQEIGGMIDKLFDLQADAREEAKLLASRQKAKQYDDYLSDQLGIHPGTKALERVYRRYGLQDQSIMFVQSAVISRAKGRDKDMTIEQTEEGGPVFDYSTTSRRQGGKRFGPAIEKQARRTGPAEMTTKVNMRMAQEMYERAKAGLKMRNRVGRTSNEEHDAMQFVHERLEKEGFYQLQQIEHEPQSGAESEQDRHDNNDQQTNDE